MRFRYPERFGNGARSEMWPVQIAFLEDLQQEAYWGTVVKINQAQALLPKRILCVLFLVLCLCRAGLIRGIADMVLFRLTIRMRGRTLSSSDQIVGSGWNKATSSRA